MLEIELRVDKEAVLTEVAQTTSYIGAKMDDENAYDRIFTTDEDKSMLQRFWDECKDTFSSMAKRLIVAQEDDGEAYTATLAMSDSFEEAQRDSVERSLFSFFVTGIVSKWNAFTNKEETQGYGAEAQANLDIVMRKLFYKKAPVRPTFE